jgi:hypothetical protein
MDDAIDYIGSPEWFAAIDEMFPEWNLDNIMPKTTLDDWPDIFECDSDTPRKSQPCRLTVRGGYYTKGSPLITLTSPKPPDTSQVGLHVTRSCLRFDISNLPENMFA